MERRATQRAQVNVPLRYATGDQWHEARCLDLSPGGLRLTGPDLARGQRVRIELRLPGDDELTVLDGIALHTEVPDDGQPVATGVKFLRVSPEIGARLAEYVAGALEGAAPNTPTPS